MDHWLEFSARRLNGQPDLAPALAQLDAALSLRTFLVGHTLTLADLCVWAALKGEMTNLIRVIESHNRLYPNISCVLLVTKVCLITVLIKPL